MRTFLLGLLCGAVLAASATVYASGEVRALLFPVKFEVNGESRELGSRFSVLNYEGHTYVPLRFMAEQLDAGASYDAAKGVVSVVSQPAGSSAAKQIWASQYRLERGMDTKEVKRQLGDPAFVTSIESAHHQLWRYDFGAASGYSYGGLTTADIDSLKKGELAGQLFIRWNGAGQVDRFDLWYGGAETSQGRSVRTYSGYPDGSTAAGVVE